MSSMPDQRLWINGGYFVLRSQIFDYLREGEELVEQPFSRLIAEQKLLTYRWAGFWQCMDTFKDKITFDRMEARGACPWMVWNKPSTDSPR
jgi:glucose-1-phosphate cytidylyltransferase